MIDPEKLQDLLESILKARADILSIDPSEDIKSQLDELYVSLTRSQQAIERFLSLDDS